MITTHTIKPPRNDLVRSAEALINTALDQRSEYKIAAEVSYNECAPEQSQYGVKYDIEPLKDDFGVDPRFVQKTVAFDFYGEDMDRFVSNSNTGSHSAEVVICSPNGGAPTLFYNIFLPEELRGIGLGRLCAMTALSIADVGHRTVAIAASPEGKRLLKVFGAKPIGDESNRREWWIVPPINELGPNTGHPINSH